MSYFSSVWPTNAFIGAAFLHSAAPADLSLQTIVRLALVTGIVFLIVGILLVGIIRGHLAQAQKRAQLKQAGTITNEPQEHSEQPQGTSDTQQSVAASPPDPPSVSSPVQTPGTDEKTTQQPQRRSQLEQTMPEKTVRLGVVLGTDLESGQKIVISQYARRQGLYLIGVNGTGKSTLLAHLIAQDLEQGLGLCLLDPKGDLTVDVLAHVPEARVQDVIVVDLTDTEYPFGLNIFTCPAPDDVEQVALTASLVTQVFEKVWHVGPATPNVSHVLRNVACTLMQNPGATFAEIPLLLQDQPTREKFVGNVTQSQVRHFWQSYNQRTAHDQMAYTSSTLKHVDALLSQSRIANIVGQSTTTLDFRMMISERKILLVQLDPGLAASSSLIGALIIIQLLNAALSRKELPAFQRKQFHVYADEYERFAIEHLASLLSEARTCGIAPTLTHQCLEHLDEKNRKACVNAANVVVFRILEQDAEELAKAFDAPSSPQPVVLRERTIRVPTSNVVKYLLKYGHPDARVAAFTTRFLVPAKRLEQRVFTGNKEARASKNMRTVGIPQLNRFLYQVMDEKNASLPIPEAIMKAFQTMPPWYFSQGKRDDFPSALLNVMEVLAKEPLMVDSKHYEPIYDQSRVSGGRPKPDRKRTHNVAKLSGKNKNGER